MPIIKFFDKLEDNVRHWLSRRPIFYAVIGSVGIALIWRGAWYLADYASAWLFGQPVSGPALYSLPLDGLISFLAGMFLLLISGLFVSQFIGNEIIISGLKGQKKLVEKTEKEIKEEDTLEMKQLVSIKSELQKISERLENLEKK